MIRSVAVNYVFRMPFGIAFGKWQGALPKSSMAVPAQGKGFPTPDVPTETSCCGCCEGAAATWGCIAMEHPAFEPAPEGNPADAPGASAGAVPGDDERGLWELFPPPAEAPDTQLVEHPPGMAGQGSRSHSVSCTI